MKHFFIFLVLSLSFFARAQDNIYLKDGTRVAAKVIRVTPSDVKYKSFNNPDGPEYILPVSDVVIVIYQNGTYDTFKKNFDQQTNSNDFDSITVNYGKNFLTFNLAGILNSNFTFSYERIFHKGFISVRVPFIAGFSDATSKNQNTVFASGLDINFYPRGQGKVRYFVGPSLEAGLKRFSSYMIWYGQGGYSYINSGVETVKRTYYNIHINNGILFQPTKNFNISTVIGIGVQAVDYGNDRDPNPNATIELNLGYKF